MTNGKLLALSIVLHFPSVMYGDVGTGCNNEAHTGTPLTKGTSGPPGQKLTKQKPPAQRPAGQLKRGAVSPIPPPL
ncbi:hypothetical protein AAFF_G00211440 [Aldrovandia affinis]|uniref:Secreted protein n=1 Tax=Aldrovandia affinis TaxID=143900 RepID=A0AAD7SXH0_9TELE|nr:hypothetical protein AAFF_G00211440 [Aldrovandia affinis]